MQPINKHMHLVKEHKTHEAKTDRSNKKGSVWQKHSVSIMHRTTGQKIQ
jgi:hypothetical protein